MRCTSRRYPARSPRSRPGPGGVPRGLSIHLRWDTADHDQSLRWRASFLFKYGVDQTTRRHSMVSVNDGDQSWRPSRRAVGVPVPLWIARPPESPSTRSCANESGITKLSDPPRRNQGPSVTGPVKVGSPAGRFVSVTSFSVVGEVPDQLESECRLTLINARVTSTPARERGFFP